MTNEYQMIWEATKRELAEMVKTYTELSENPLNPADFRKRAKTRALTLQEQLGNMELREHEYGLAADDANAA